MLQFNYQKTTLVGTGILCTTHMECKKCKHEYIGETQNTLKDRMLEHLGYVRREENTATGHHFNLPGHSMSDMSISVLERIRSYDPQYRKTRESYMIEQFDLLRNGINRKRWFALQPLFKNVKM